MPVFALIAVWDAVIAEPMEVEAVVTRESVFALTAEVTPAVALVVFAFTTAAIEVEAVVTSDWSASVPEDKVPAVSVLEP